MSILESVVRMWHLVGPRSSDTLPTWKRNPSEGTKWRKAHNLKKRDQIEVTGENCKSGVKIHGIQRKERKIASSV